ncbi:MAG: DUF2891 domain-containing protein [Gemmatimonas sp.]|uniref:DUF2891 domain-containing protein n=1 Tax=Gemmatimonas sp. TaxID=1962908 RepID=UPI00391FBF94
MTAFTLDAPTASHFARLALAHVRREYPNKLDHVLLGPADVRGPAALHPVFHGSFDWHSCVHGYWLLATLRRVRPGISEAPAIDAQFEAQFTAENMAAERAYAAHPARGGFERPYGWAWLLMLAAELSRHDTPAAARWAAVLQPLADVFVARFMAFLPKATYPIRVGTHFNTAFALRLALEYADQRHHEAFGAQLRETARRWYEGDRDCQAWEPGGDDFLSSALIEAECRRVAMPADAFRTWFDAFLPRLAQGEPATLFRPATVSDRTDGKIAHLDGLNLSRAWCWRSIAAALPPADPRRRSAREAAEQHLRASLPYVAGDYMGEHWLATFALLALLADGQA